MTGGAVQTGGGHVNHGNQERVRDLGIISTGIIIQEEKKEEKGRAKEKTLGYRYLRR